MTVSAQVIEPIWKFWHRQKWLRRIGSFSALAVCASLFYYAGLLYHIQQGNEAFERKNYEAALESFGSIQDRTPSWLALLPGYSSPLREALLKQLQLYYLTREFDSGMKYLEGLSARYPMLEEDGEFHLWWGNFLFQHALAQEDAEILVDGLYAGLREYQKALQINPENWDARYNYELVKRILSAEEQEGQQKLELLIDELRRKIRPRNEELPPEKRG